MSEHEFSPGQRWVSNTEPELGLGLVVEVGHRRVHLSFPAAGEERFYASDNAPLSRVQYRPGDVIRSAEDLAITVETREEHDGCYTYSGADEHGSRVTLHELELDSFVQFSRPLDRLFTGQIDKASAFHLRVATLGHHHEHHRSPAFGLVGPRVQLLPHQFYIASEVSSRHAPRVLLADEVGLGKTIEAGLILHQQLCSGRVARALLIVPEHLLHQWLVEMLRRFNLHFSILDAQTAEAWIAAGEDNPFETAQLVLAPLSFLTENEAYASLAREAGWDLLIVDEAHHLTWDQTGPGAAYACIEALARYVPGVLLLSATPEQLGVSGHFARLRLLDPQRFHDLDAFLAEEAGYRELSDVLDRLLEAPGAAAIAEDPGLHEALERYLGSEQLARRLAHLESAALEEARAELVQDLIDRHGTGRVMFRNCRDNIEGFPGRRLQAWPLSPPAGFVDAGTEPARQLTPEQQLGEGWLAADPRVAWLAEWLRSHRTEKALVICHSAATARALEEHLRLRHGAPTAVFHEAMELVARDRAAAWFAEPEGAQALVCSEIGSEGRNFQFACQLVLFDLPLSVDLLEQRIGRLDRIGQRRPVQIHVPYYERSAQAVLLRWLHEGLNAFVQTCPAGQALLEEFGSELQAVMRHPKDEGMIAALIARTAEHAAELAAVLQAGRDRLLELASCNPQRAGEIVIEVGSAARPLELSEYMGAVFDQYGVDYTASSALSGVVHPGDHMLCRSFPGLPEDGLNVTFDRSQALAREDIQFLTWEHPMVAGAMEMIQGSEFGNVSFGTVKAPPLAPGTLLLEVYHVLHCPAPRELGIPRFLPAGAVRTVVDSNNRALGETLTPQWFSRSIQAVPARTAAEAVKRVRAQVEALAEQATMFAQVSRSEMVGAALAALEAEGGRELERLRHLAAVNPHIRSEEIDYLVRTNEARAACLDNTQLRLDAVRLAVVT